MGLFGLQAGPFSLQAGPFSLDAPLLGGMQPLLGIEKRRRQVPVRAGANRVDVELEPRRGVTFEYTMD